MLETNKWGCFTGDGICYLHLIGLCEEDGKNADYSVTAFTVYGHDDVLYTFTAINLYTLYNNIS